MNTISVRDMKAHWSQVEERVRRGEEFIVLNRGVPAARIGPARPSEIVFWEDHLATAVRPQPGISSEESLRLDRDGRW